MPCSPRHTVVSVLTKACDSMRGSSYCLPMLSGIWTSSVPRSTGRRPRRHDSARLQCGPRNRQKILDLPARPANEEPVDFRPSREFCGVFEPYAATVKNAVIGETVFQGC